MTELSDNRGSMSTRTSSEKDKKVTNATFGSKTGKKSSSKSYGDGSNGDSLAKAMKEELQKQYGK